MFYWNYGIVAFNAQIKSKNTTVAVTSIFTQNKLLLVDQMNILYMYHRQSNLKSYTMVEMPF